MKDDVLAVVDRTWRRLGVPRDVRAELHSELAADLAEAAADGRPALDYVGGDPAGLARSWASARGAVRPRLRLLGVTAAGLVAMVPGASFGLLLVVAPSSMALNDLLLSGRGSMVSEENGMVTFTYAVEPPAWAVLSWYLLAALFAYGGGLAAVSAVLQAAGDVARRPTLRLLAAVLPVAAVLATAAGVAVASSRSYAATGPVLTATCAVVLAVVGVAIALTRLVATRRVGRAAPATV